MILFVAVCLYTNCNAVYEDAMCEVPVWKKLLCATLENYSKCLFFFHSFFVVLKCARFH